MLTQRQSCAVSAPGMVPDLNVIWAFSSEVHHLPMKSRNEIYLWNLHNLVWGRIFQLVQQLVKQVDKVENNTVISTYACCILISVLKTSWWRFLLCSSYQCNISTERVLTKSVQYSALTNNTPYTTSPGQYILSLTDHLLPLQIKQQMQQESCGSTSII